MSQKISDRAGTVIVRMLRADEVGLFAQNLATGVASSGLGDTPIFTLLPRSVVLEPEKIAFKSVLWQIDPIQDGLWERCFGVFDGIGGGLLGTLTLGNERLHRSAYFRAHLGMSFVPVATGKGYGRLLLSYACHWAAAQKTLRWIDLSVFSHNHRARRMYKDVGFVETGYVKEAFFHLDRYLDEVQMTLDLGQLR
jgi:RimJ/RimL family protein N-acetyltransferase